MDMKGVSASEGLTRGLTAAKTTTRRGAVMLKSGDASQGALEEADDGGSRLDTIRGAPVRCGGAAGLVPSVVD